MNASEARPRRSPWLIPAAIVATGALIFLVMAIYRPLVPLPEGAVRIPTSEMVTDADTLCPLGAVVPALGGVLSGDKSDTAWPVWLTEPTGRDIYIRWPWAWSARFAPDAQLLDEDGRLAAIEGHLVELSQVDRSSAAGTREDPYIATGWFLSRCYVLPR